MVSSKSKGAGRMYVTSTADDTKVKCQLCGEEFTKRGIKSHQGSCERKHDKKRRNREYADLAAQAVEAQRKEQLGAAADLDVSLPGPSQLPDSVPSPNVDAAMFDAGFEGYSDPAIRSEGSRSKYDIPKSIYSSNEFYQHYEGSSGAFQSMESIHGPEVPDAPVAFTVSCDSFKTEYHPKSGRSPDIDQFSAFNRTASLPQFMDEEPWLPFQSETDLEFAEIAHQAALNKEHTEALLHIIWKISTTGAKFTFKTHTDVCTAWKSAAEQLTPFEHHIIPVPYKQGTLEFNLYLQSIWDWAMDLLGDPLLAPHFVWDAQCLYKHNGTCYERFIDEPWTADRWWRIQSQLPADKGAPFAFVLYADKTQLSLFGTVKAYPVIARCGNLPVQLRNGKGVGGGRLVGWLPIVPENSEEDGKLLYVNLKCVVWHESFRKLLETIIVLSAEGFGHKCFDNVLRVLYPIILILSGDYEEQCVMALIRGMNLSCPCPICLVPRDKLTDHSTDYPHQTIEDAKACLVLYGQNHTMGEKKLKEQGLRPIENVFWLVKNSSPHDALCFDPLHVDSGLWGDHLFGRLKAHLTALGHNASKMVDSHITNISFSDGNKLRDITKQILYAAQNVLTRQADLAGYLLLQCIASYLRYHTLILLDVHTEQTLEDGEAELLKFQGLLDVRFIDTALVCSFITHLQTYIHKTLGSKNWNFPKAHSAKHAFHDIREKGASRNFSTCPNESEHGPIKNYYSLQTNKKDIAEQILRLDHKTFVSQMIHSRISELRIQTKNKLLGPEELDNSEHSVENSPSALDSFNFHHHLGSPRVSITFKELEGAYSTDRAFLNFYHKVTAFLDNLSLVEHSSLSGIIKPAIHDKLQEHQYLKVHYESMVDWRLLTDYLRCSPKFHGLERCDCALVRTLDLGADQNKKIIVVQLLFMFRYTVAGHTFDLALVLPMDVPTGPRHSVDHDLRLRRFHSHSHGLTEIISLRSIIHGALLVPDFSREGDFFLVDFVDGDIFICAQRYNL
ncbi:hypothetical protein JVU11DRAFT_9611 [Chiua virens]|nr:hypothetical protein JVU11DRAFT_9611 [Chiua virens]